MEPLFEFLLRHPSGRKMPKSEHLYRELRSAITEGRLPSGVQLPSTRNAQDHFNLSRNTVASVYERLATEGLITSRPGAGFYVSHFEKSSGRREAAATKTDPRLNEIWSSPAVARAMHFWDEEPASLASLIQRRPIDFRPGLIDLELFPHQALRRLVPAQLRAMERKPAASKSPQGNAGHFPLRAAIGRHVGTTRAIAVAPEEVIVTAGAQQAFDLIGRTLIKPGITIVAIEEPGYPPLRAALIAAGAILQPVPVDEEGMVVESLKPGVSVICVCPSHQFPLGLTMSPERRKQLIDYARRNHAVIVEDDYDAEFRLEGELVEALRNEETADLVFYVGTFSKCMLPSLRLGYLIPPAWALKTLVLAKNCLDWHCPSLTQGLVAAFVSEGHLERHVKKMRAEYRKRRDEILRHLAQPEFADFNSIRSSYGMHVTAISRADIDCESLAMALRKNSVEVHTLQRYFLGPATAQGFMFGFGSTNVQQIESALSALKHHLTLSRRLRDTNAPPDLRGS